MRRDARLIWVPQAWLGASQNADADGWATNVMLEIDEAGCWGAITPAISRATAAAVGATCFDQTLLPSLVNTHSHAFQRAFSGLSERRTDARDDFWSWRDRMYRVALAVSPAELSAVAAQLYSELLRGGYTQVCEFHYLHHNTDGAPYANPYAMADALIDAAQRVGIGLTMLPVLYERAGFSVPTLRHDQRRFATDAAWVLSLQRHVATRAVTSATPLNAGVAIHSLRAATPASIKQLADAFDGPIHIHVAEQTAEVDDCLASTGMRPVEWLAANQCLDSRWQLVHATHVTQSEIDAVARAGAGVVICPTTEANLGDGLTDAAAWFDAGVGVSIGSDSHVTREWREELRWLDYGQRLVRRQRNVLASPHRFQGSTAAVAFASAVTHGAAAFGQSCWGLQVGARADGLLLNARDPALMGLPASHALDALVFSSPPSAYEAVMVAGRVVHRQATAQTTQFEGAFAASVGDEFVNAMRQLHG